MSFPTGAFFQTQVPNTSTCADPYASAFPPQSKSQGFQVSDEEQGYSNEMMYDMCKMLECIY